MRPASAERAARLAVVLLLAASIPSFASIPYLAPWGLDFTNLYAFHHCAARDEPYVATGVQCFDPLGRDMVYPPLLYWSFAWVRLLDWQTARRAWETVVALGVLGALLAWIPAPRWSGQGAAWTGLFAGLLVAQYPVLFALERGNNDVLVLVAWALALRLHLAGRPALAGLVAGTSVALKLYPAFAALTVGAALLVDARARPAVRRDVAAFAAGGVAAVLLGFAVVLPDVRAWISGPFAAFTAARPVLTIYGHPLHLLAPSSDGWALSLPLLAVWVVAAARTLRRDPALAFAGALAISTWFASTSWDYNLVTALPLLLVLFLRATGGPAPARAFALLGLGLVAIVAPRAIFAGSDALMSLRIALGWLWLVATAVAAAAIAERAPATPSGATGRDAALLPAG